MKKKIALLFMCSLALCSCKKTTFLNADIEKITTRAGVSDGNIDLHSDGEEYKLEHYPSWMEVSLKDSVIDYKIIENTTDLTRQDSIVVSNGDMKLVIPVTQNHRCTTLTADQTSIQFPKEGGTQTVNITTDGFVDVEAESTVEATLKDNVLTVVAQPNKGGIIKGDIKLTADEKELTINYTIAGNVCKRCNGRGRISCPNCRGTGISYIRPTLSLIEYCTVCGGVGVECMGYEGPIRQGSGVAKCPDCGGTGYQK